MGHISYTYEETKRYWDILIQKRINNIMATENRQHYKPLSKHDTETISSSSSTTCTHPVTHLTNPVIRHKRVREILNMSTQHIQVFW
jgi:hypothetical protein